MVEKLKAFSLLKFLLSILLLSFSSEQCVLGGNCPYDQGICMADYCKCLDGFYSLLNSSLPPEQQIYCNYEQINVYVPLVLEMCLPSIGHFYVENYWLGALKLFLLISFIATSYLRYGFVGVPTFVLKIMDKLGLSLKNFCPEGVVSDEEKEDGKNENNNNDNEENNEADGGEEAAMKALSHIFRATNPNSNENTKEINDRGKITQVEQAHNAEGKDVFKKELEKPLINYEEGENKDDEIEKEENKTLTTLFNISCVFWILYFVDLYCYKFKIYNDGNGVPFVE